jgi:HK97 family phage major capsid protein
VVRICWPIASGYTLLVDRLEKALRTKSHGPLGRVSALPVDSIVRGRLEYTTGLTKEKAYLLGDGAQKPRGAFVPHADGVPTSRDVLTGSATDFTADGLIDAKHEMKPQYWPGARWAWHRYGLQSIRKLEDSQNHYLWQPGLTGGNPDAILDLPHDVSEYVPNTFTTGQYVGLLANWQEGYWVVDSLDMGIEFLDQLYAKTNQNGYILRYEGDGAPVLAGAFVRTGVYRRRDSRGTQAAGSAGHSKAAPEQTGWTSYSGSRGTCAT